VTLGCRRQCCLLKQATTHANYHERLDLCFTQTPQNLRLSRVTVSALAHPDKRGRPIDKLHRFLQPIHQVTRQPWCFFRTSRQTCSNMRLTIGSIGGMLRQPTDTMLVCRLPPHSLPAVRLKPLLLVLCPSTALAPLLRTLSREMGTKSNTRKACRAISLKK
jgi:hypothetical protein